MIFVVMSVESFKTDVIVFIGDVCTSDRPLNLRMLVTNWPNMFGDQGQFIDPDLISCTHQRKNVQFTDLFIWLKERKKNIKLKKLKNKNKKRKTTMNWAFDYPLCILITTINSKFRKRRKTTTEILGSHSYDLLL